MSALNIELMKEEKVRVVTFDADKYPEPQDDFKRAVMAGDVHILDIDEDSYTMFYNIQNCVFGTARMLGKKVHMGTAKNDVFVTIDEMDGSEDVDYGSKEEGFLLGVAFRKNLEENI